MGRKRLPLAEKKVRVNVSVKRKHVDLLKQEGINISQIIEDYVKNYKKEE